MLTRTDNIASVDAILGSLALKEETYGASYETQNDEDYRMLLRAALDGRLEGKVTVARSGIFLNGALIQPPVSPLAKTAFSAA